MHVFNEKGSLQKMNFEDILLTFIELEINIMYYENNIL